MGAVRSGNYVQHLETRLADAIEQLENIGMTLNEYQIQAAATAIYQEKMYPITSLMVESAELADIFIKPYLRGDQVTVDKDRVASEAGDVLWNLAALLNDHGLSLDLVARKNLMKLQDRKERNVLMGSGDNR